MFPCTQPLATPWIRTPLFPTHAFTKYGVLQGVSFTLFPPPSFHQTRPQNILPPCGCAWLRDQSTSCVRLLHGHRGPDPHQKLQRASQARCTLNFVSALATIDPVAAPDILAIVHIKKLILSPWSPRCQRFIGAKSAAWLS